MSTKLLGDIRCFLLDMDGTVYLGDHLLPGAEAFISHLENKKLPYYFLTNNSSRSGAQYAGKLRRLGLAVNEDQVFTSGMATAIFLKKHHPDARLYVVGTPALEDEFRSNGFQLVEKDPDCVILGFDTTLTYNKIWRLCDFVRAGRPYIATHPDTNCPTETGFMPDIGSMLALVATSTGRQPDVVIGKPNAPIIEAIVEKTGFPASALAMIGDRLYTDIAMGAAGITTILVLSGETKPDDLATSPFQPDFIFDNLQAFLDVYKDDSVSRTSGG
jgi:4-nitrophenyl phosphatase